MPLEPLDDRPIGCFFAFVCIMMVVVIFAMIIGGWALINLAYENWG